MKKLARGWSGKKSTQLCPRCQRRTEHEIIQYQPMRNIGPVNIMGKGTREFGYECLTCLQVSTMNEKNSKSAMKLKYRTKRGEEGSLKKSGKVYFPALDEKRRAKIVKQNKKEAWQSAGFATLFGLIIAPFWIWSLAIAGVFIILSFYLAYEDPERKHRDLHKAGKKI